MAIYYELMVFLRRDNECRKDDDTNFENGSELDSMALNHEIDSESQTVATALGIIQ